MAVHRSRTAGLGHPAHKESGPQGRRTVGSGRLGGAAWRSERKRKIKRKRTIDGPTSRHGPEGRGSSNGGRLGTGAFPRILRFHTLSFHTLAFITLRFHTLAFNILRFRPLTPSHPHTLHSLGPITNNPQRITARAPRARYAPSLPCGRNQRRSVIHLSSVSFPVRAAPSFS